MPIYELTKERVTALAEVTFAEVQVRERDDLQRVLRDKVEVIAPDTLVVAEEFGEWEDSRRRIDLLGVHKRGDLVVVELKRTEDGGHMELQALRYAAMISAMTFDRVAALYGEHLARTAAGESQARERLLEFLG